MACKQKLVLTLGQILLSAAVPIIVVAEQPATPGPKLEAEQPIIDKNSETIREIVREELEKAKHEGPFDLSFHGYGDIRYAYYDYPENIQASEGSRGDSRGGFDITRFVFELEGEHRESGIEFEAEVEYEHGGSGTATELEFDEFGEFENEVEKGGEVVLEELYLQKEFDNGFTLRGGRFYVAMGMLSDYHLPTDYIATGRSEAETTVIPAVWDEIGVDVKKQFEFGTLTFQIVNGLDSSGFGASQWVASGHQTKFESTRAEDLAYITRFDYTDVPGFMIGSSVYVGNSNGNRPKEDVEGDGTVTIVDGHTRLEYGGFRFQGLVLWGHLSDADEISERNSRLPNSLGAERTAVGDEAMAAWGEIGYDIAPHLGMEAKHRLEPFFRYDYYDTYFDNRADLADTGRYERNVLTGGVGYTYDKIVVVKLDYTYREYGDSAIDSENMVRLGLGFVY